jgi:hypothetical protein
VKRLVALIVGVAFAAGLAGSALAQTTPAPAAPPKTETAPKTETKTDAKKPASLNASGTVKTAAPDSLVVSGKAKGKDAEWTFAVDPKTKIRKNNKDVTAADLAAGDSVQVRYHAEGGKNVADSVMVHARKTTAAPATAPKAETPKKDETKK